MENADKTLLDRLQCSLS